VRNLVTNFRTSAGVQRAVDGVSFDVARGETLGIVGESGCGKSVTALSIMRLVDSPGVVEGGEVLYDGVDILKLPMAQMRRIRGNKIAMIFQEPMTSLNPVLTVGTQISEVLRLHEGLGKKEALDKAVEMLSKVHIPMPEKRVRAYPHQMSGGMRQRVMIAMALCCKPDVLICDEPTTALDVTIQAQILSLIQEMKNSTGAAVIMITHDLGVISEIADRVAVMYTGHIIEEGSKMDVLTDPLHPYTEGLLNAAPRIDRDCEELEVIPGAVPNLAALPKGCHFRPRCRRAMEICRTSPEKTCLGEKGGRSVSCWKFAERAKHAKHEGKGERT
jgi:peptide/nickel transport system ATP-binding protein/oligopeptide transport system ATP-binding protein